MKAMEFNLLHEPWILVLRDDGTSEEVSLLDLFRRAPEWLRLAGELPTQDVAIMRLLLAVLHAVVARYEISGAYSPIASPASAVNRWKRIWDNGCFPIDAINRYLSHFEDRFWLFHPKHPFYQVPNLHDATQYTSAKLNGELSESNNKARLFPQRTGTAKSALTFAEATRWLIYVNAYDDTSAKPKQKGLPSSGAGWLGKLGLIQAEGASLFHSIMLNLVLVRDGGDTLWAAEAPTWERAVKHDERTPIAMPENLSELYTLQSRRLLLHRTESHVSGYSLLGGDFFGKENALVEQMTVWRNAAKKGSAVPEYHPRRHTATRQLWRDLPAIISQAGARRRPGIVNWIARLRSEQAISYAQVSFRTASVQYGDKDFFVDDVFSDAISLNTDLLTTLGSAWSDRILAELEVTDKLVGKVGTLAQELAIAAGHADGQPSRQAAKEQAYFRLDTAYRIWLVSIDPEETSMAEVCDQWWEQARKLVVAFGKELVRDAGPKAFTGRVVKENQREKRYIAAEAYNRFLYYTAKRDLL